MARLWRGYIRLLRDYTLPTQMASGATLMSTGDAISQHVVERKPLAAHDWGRTSRFAYYSVRQALAPDWLTGVGVWLQPDRSQMALYAQSSRPLSPVVNRCRPSRH